MSRMVSTWYRSNAFFRDNCSGLAGDAGRRHRSDLSTRRRVGNKGHLATRLNPTIQRARGPKHVRPCRQLMCSVSIRSSIRETADAISVAARVRWRRRAAPAPPVSELAWQAAAGGLATTPSCTGSGMAAIQAMELMPPAPGLAIVNRRAPALPRGSGAWRFAPAETQILPARWILTEGVRSRSRDLKGRQ
jgi:hypothetical protein